MKTPTEPVTLFVVEGLGYGDFVTEKLVDPLRKDYKFNFLRIAWGSSCPGVYPEGKLIAVGHSLGGPKVLECVKQSGRSWELVMTLDPRVTGQPYSAPLNALKTVNIYQTNLLNFRGYPVAGAEEHIVQVGHTDLPGHPLVKSTLTGYLSR